MAVKSFLDLTGLQQFGSKIVELLNNKIDKDQGIENSGKFMSVGTDGILTSSDLPYKIEVITQTEYDALTTPDSSTLYVIEV